jgi:hypothetical protein
MAAVCVSNSFVIRKPPFSIAVVGIEKTTIKDPTVRHHIYDLDLPEPLCQRLNLRLVA